MPTAACRAELHAASRPTDSRAGNAEISRTGQCDFPGSPAAWGMSTISRSFRAACATPFLLATLLPGQTVVFSSDFDGSMPSQVAAGSALLEGVQGFAGLGPAGNQFANTFLRSPTGNAVTIQLTGLPPHNAIAIDVLFAAIDSLDGTGSFPGGDFLAIEIDGNTFFRESFANATAGQIQSYVAPAGVTLARRVDLGFGGPGSFYTDSAYWLGGDPMFQSIGHTASTLTIRLQIEGPGIQSLSDESWGIDNLTIRTLQVSNPGSITSYGISCGPVLSALGNPLAGATLSTFVSNLPSTAVLAGLAWGLSNAAPLPLSLDSLGATGCFAHHDAAINMGSPMLVQLPAATASAPIPNQASVVGVTFFLQSWAFVPGANALGLLTSNGLRVQLGQ